METNNSLTKMCGQVCATVKDVRYTDKRSIVLKPPEDCEFTSDEIKEKAVEALENLKIISTEITDDGKLVVKVPNKEEHEKANKGLKDAFESFELCEQKKITPKIKIVGVKMDVENNTVIDNICEKDAKIKEMHQSGEVLAIVKTFNANNNSKILILKCSPKIRNYIIDTCNGFVYFNGYASRAYDSYDVPICYHCCGFNHFANNCPHKEKPAICRKCSGPHVAKNCSSDSLKCVNCVRIKSRDTSHIANSSDCPQLLKEKERLIKRTKFACQKN